MTDWTTERPAGNAPGWLFANQREYGKYGVGLTMRGDPYAGRATRWWRVPDLDAPGWLDPHDTPPERPGMFLYHDAEGSIGLAYWAENGRPIGVYTFEDCGPCVERWHALPSTPRQ